MDKKYQREELITDIAKKDMRIKILEKENSDLFEMVDKLQKKLDIAMEGLKHIDSEENWVIAQKCLNEIFEK